MPLFLEQPSYGPRGPDGQGWNRLSLNAHFDTRHQCGLMPTTYAALYESTRGLQSWGPYERCSSSGHCSACPVQRLHLERDGVDWPAGSPLLLARVRPLPLSPGLMFADPAAGRSTLHLRTWRGEDVDVEADWRTVRNSPGLRLGRAFWDEEGHAFWLVRSNPAAASAVVRTRRFQSHTRHALYGSDGGRRLALLSCHGGCAHDEGHLRLLAADLAGGRPIGSQDSAVLPERLPAVPGIEFGHVDGRTVLQRDASPEYSSSTTYISWAAPADMTAVTALLAHAVRLTGH
ncbi:hypothetical protein ACFW6N_32525 [Streptomyces cyaneofuscatus]|uniref:hypothetical protein n=1 Tax=Streptomyces cyaneofuscatus TaxID=66883 RepID=UPI00367E9BB8